jgi:hypothetical protein
MFAPVIIGWDGLKLPLFSHQISVSEDAFDFQDRSPIKVFWQAEPPEVMPHVADKLIEHRGFYDLILAWDDRILSQCRNARLFPYGGVWARGADTSQKKFAVSMIASSKNFCAGHAFRLQVFNMLPATVVRHQSPPFIPTKHSLLVPYQYSIVMENGRHINYFTEKINDALATKTIPIYWGAPNIGDFYNTDGILSFQTVDELFEILNRLTPDFYKSREAAIEDNYRRTFKYEQRTQNLVEAVNQFLETR